MLWKILFSFRWHIILVCITTKNQPKSCTFHGMYGICHCLNLIVFTLSYHSHIHHSIINLLPRGKLYANTFCHLTFPSITNCIMYFKMYADEMQQVTEIKFFFFQNSPVKKSQIAITPKLLFLLQSHNNCCKHVIEKFSYIISIAPKLLFLLQSHNNCCKHVMEKCSYIISITPKLLFLLQSDNNCCKHVMEKCSYIISITPKLLFLPQSHNNCCKHVMEKCSYITSITNWKVSKIKILINLLKSYI